MFPRARRTAPAKALRFCAASDSVLAAQALAKLQALHNELVRDPENQARPQRCSLC